MLRDLSIPAATLLTLACTGDTEPADTSQETDTRSPGESQVVQAFDGEYIYYGSKNRRTVDLEVEFPDETTTYTSIRGRFDLDCPNNKCDWWDRYATFGVVLDAGTEEEQFVELDRFITPYRVGFDWEADLTHARPLLTGTVTLRVFIDTWVAEGHSNGDGWLFTAEFDLEGGPPPSPEPIAVLPVWGHLSWLAGLEDNPVEGQVVPQSISVPEASQYTFRSFITGHGWDNTQNCAEFCAQDHYYTVAGEEFGREVWREDCSETETDGTQQGTWQYSRAGWCPGAQVWPWDTDVTESIGGASEVDMSYRLNDWEWWGDGDQPYYYMSGVLVAWD
jgi:hypothetical protein